MSKISVLVLADTESGGDMGRVANAFATVKEAAACGDDVELVFDGAAVKWPGALAGGAHKLSPAFEAIREHVTGACEYCAGAFGVEDEVRGAGVPFLGEFEGHPSLRQRVAEGFQVITF